MSYYFLHEKKKVPSLLAYSFILVLTLSLGFFLKNIKTSTVSKASKKTVPQNITISNLTNKSAVICFITSEKTKSLIKYGISPKLDKLKFDDRDLVKQTERTLHFFTLDQLKTNQDYVFEIYISNQKFISDSQPLKFKTFNSNVRKVSYPPIYGKILGSNFQPQKEVLINLTINKAKHLTYSALSKKTGEWIITFPYILSNKLSQISLNDDDLMTLNLTDSKSDLITKVIVKYKDAKPLKTLIIGNNYDFTKSGKVMGLSINKNASNLISYPRDNAIINSNYPVFRGIGMPNSLIQLTTEPVIFSTIIKTNNKGEWQYQNIKPILAGNYELIVLDKDQKLADSIVFSIGKSGESVLGDATPSGTIIPTISPTTIISPTVLPTTISTPNPTQIQPTITASPIPKSGLNNNLLILFSSGLSLFGLFLVLY